jgi:phosphohistidine phosphatase SixA
MPNHFRDIFLLRHAHADAQLAGQSDFDRPLSDLGKRQAEQSATWLKSHLGGATRVLCSPAVRTQQTLQALLDQLEGLQPRMEASIYEASPGALLMLLDREFDARSLLLVGHNPGLESAVALLSAGRSNDARGMPVGAIAQLRLRDGAAIEPGAAELVNFWSP